jgi:hypothetical protein
MASKIDLAHATRTKPAHDLVGADLFAGRNLLR